MATRHDVFVVRGREYGYALGYETKVPNRIYCPRRPKGDQFVTLGVDAWDSQSDARAQAWANVKAEAEMKGA